MAVAGSQWQWRARECSQWPLCRPLSGTACASRWLLLPGTRQTSMNVIKCIRSFSASSISAQIQPPTVLEAALGSGGGGSSRRPCQARRRQFQASQHDIHIFSVYRRKYLIVIIFVIWNQFKQLFLHNTTTPTCPSMWMDCGSIDKSDLYVTDGYNSEK